jgi:hypothetical protein
VVINLFFDLKYFRVFHSNIYLKNPPPEKIKCVWSRRDIAHRAEDHRASEKALPEEKNICFSTDLFDICRKLYYGAYKCLVLIRILNGTGGM